MFRPLAFFISCILSLSDYSGQAENFIQEYKKEYIENTQTSFYGFFLSCFAFLHYETSPKLGKALQYAIGKCEYKKTGSASWYGPGFHGKITANGEIYNQNAMTAAHKTLPFGTRLHVQNLSNGKSVVVRINDRGPFIGSRVLDLSKEAARRLNMLNKGVVKVRLLSLDTVSRFSRRIGDTVSGDFYIQISAFSEGNNAVKMINDMKTKGYECRSIPRNDLIFVQVGPYANLTAAEEEMSKLKIKFPDSFVVRSK